MTKPIHRYIIGGLFAFPAAAFLSAGILLVLLSGLEEHSSPFRETIIAVFLASWLVAGYWAAKTDSFESVFSRGCWAFTISILIFLVGWFVWGATGSPGDPDAIFPRPFIIWSVAFIVVFTGMVAFVLALVVAPSGSPERSPTRLFQEVGDIALRFSLLRIVVVLVLIILGVVMLRVGSAEGWWSEKYTEITTNFGHTCGVRTDGTAHCWGSARTVPPRGEKFVSIALGKRLACGLKGDGSVLCWGTIPTKSDDSWSVNPSMEISRGPYLEITASDRNICGLRPDGSVVCWGSYRVHYTNKYIDQVAPPDGERFITISAASSHTCGIRSDGGTVCWGSVDPPPEGEQFTAISSASLHTCGIRREGDIFCWWNRESYTNDRPHVYGPGPFTALSAGGDSVCGLLTDGSVQCWRWGTSTMRNNSSREDPVKGERFVSISNGGDYNCGLRHNGTAKCWGGDRRDNMHR